MINKNHDALLGYLETYVTSNRKNLFKRVLDLRTRHFTVVLEDIYQSHNSSAVLRSCDVFGVQDVHVIENKYVSKVSRHVAKGAQKWLTLYRYQKNMNNTLTCLTNLQSKGYQIIATTPHNDSCLLSDFDVTQKSAFVFGVEKEGVSKTVLENANGYLKIPMVGFTESLNISVAAAIILNDVANRLKKTDYSWQLYEEEKLELYKEWIEKSIKNVDKIKAHFLESKK